MPTRRLHRLSMDKPLTYAKENVSNAMLPTKERMSRKRCLSEPGDENNGGAAEVLRLRQEVYTATDHIPTDSKDSAGHLNASNERKSRRSSSAQLYAQSLQNAKTRKQGNSKRLKVSTDNNSVMDQFLSEDSKVVAVSVSKQTLNSTNAAEFSMSVTADYPADEPTPAKSSLPQSKSRSRLMLKNRKQGGPKTDSEQSCGVAEPGENEEKEPAVAAGDNMDTVNQEDGDSLFRVPVVAPALKNLGNTCFLNSIVQVLYYSPAFVENVKILCKDMRTTISDYNRIRTVTSCVKLALSKYCKFIMLLNQLFNDMAHAEQLFLSGREAEAISPHAFLEHLQVLSQLFRHREQQDSHECLRSILLYVQETARAINQQRAIHHDITTSAGRNNNSVPPSARDFDSVADVAENRSLPELVNDSTMQSPDGLIAGYHLMAETTCTCATVTGSVVTPATDDLKKSSFSSSNSSVQNLMAEESKPPNGSESSHLSSSAGPDKTSNTDNTMSKASVGTVAIDSSTKSSRPCSNGSKQNLASKETKLPDSSKSHRSSLPAPLNKMSSAGKINDYFPRALPPPRSAADITVTAQKVSDFVEATFEGKSDRLTRCLECESRTQCTEMFQDVEVVAKEAVTAEGQSDEPEDSCSSDDECWIVKSLQEVELLYGDNKYFCSECLHLIEATRSVVYQQMPQILTIQIKRFVRCGVGYTKCMACVELPFILPCLEANCKSAAPECKCSDHWYELYAMVCHTGISLHSGHYISYIRAPLANAATLNATNSAPESSDRTDTQSLWLICNDHDVTAVSEVELKRKLSVERCTTPYILFYQRTTV